MKYIDQDKCDLFYFINSDVTVEERLKMIYEFDTPDDYSYHKSDAYKLEMCKEIVEISHLFKDECMRCDIKFYNSSYVREQIIENFIVELGDPVFS